MLRALSFPFSPQPPYATKRPEYILMLSICFLDSDYGRLSVETWRFLNDIYEGGPVFFIEGHKDSEEEKQEKQEQDEEAKQ